MMPDRVVGTAILPGGKRTPFVLVVASGSVEAGSHATPDVGQAMMTSHAVVRERVMSELGAVEVRLGHYFCELCQRWVDVVAAGSDWNVDRCGNC